MIGGEDAGFGRQAAGDGKAIASGRALTLTVGLPLCPYQLFLAVALHGLEKIRA